MEPRPVRRPEPMAEGEGGTRLPAASNRAAPARLARNRACPGRAGAARFVDGQIARDTRTLPRHPENVNTAVSTASSADTPATGPSFGSRAAAARFPRRTSA